MTALAKRPVLTVNQWLESVPADRKDAINAVRKTINKRLPKGYEETVDWGMLAWVVPLSTQPETYNGHALMLAALGAHKKLMTVYLMTVYGDPRIRKEFETAYRKTGKKLNMGGSCVHFKTLDDLPLEVIGDAIARVSVDKFVEAYHQSRTRRSSQKKAAAKPSSVKRRR